MNLKGCVLLAAILAPGIVAHGADDLTCLSDEERGESQLYVHLQQEAYAALERRGEVFEDLRTPQQIEAYQQRLRAFFIEQLGGFPERTPLHARTVGTLQADGYQVEKVIYESLPQHHVTANLYLPHGEGPFPGVVVSSGHSRTGKTADYNQRFGIMLARHGMAVLCYDPIGQGERSQILDDQGQPRFASTTAEHFLIGAGSILVGRNTARYRVWDAIRSIDYLAARVEVDPQRIGFTGCSGGGTLTSYVMALDDRVVCAAPACYLTTFQRLIETIGPQDAEQNIFGQLAFGLDQPDYILLRAPKPTLISSTTNDFFDIRGSWENFRQAKRIYTQLGFPERVDLVEAPGDHGVQPENLAAITQWMRRWLLNRDEPVKPVQLAIRPAEQLLCVESGQVLLQEGEHSVFDLNAQHADELRERRRSLWSSTNRDTLVERIANSVGVKDPPAIQPVSWKDVARVPRDGYHIDKLVLETRRGVPLPALTFHPPVPDDAAYLYLHEAGKLGDASPGGPIEQLVEEGYAVVTVDLSGQGETAAGPRDGLRGDWKTFYLAYLLGKSLIGIRVEDTLAAGHWVAYYERKENDPRPVHLVGVGKAGIIALHAAALRPDLFATVTLKNTPREWTAVVKEPVPAGQLDYTVHGALQLYDLPELVQLAGEEKVKFAP